MSALNASAVKFLRMQKVIVTKITCVLLQPSALNFVSKKLLII